MVFMTLPRAGWPEPSLPHHFANHVTEIPPDLLTGQHVMFDWDATLVMHGHRQVERRTAAWLGNQAISGISIATLNPVLRQAHGLEDWEPAIYGPRVVTNPETGHRKPVTKLQQSFFEDAARQEGISPDQVTVIDNSYLFGAQAASRAGCRVILVAPLKHGLRPDNTRLGHLFDRWRLTRDRAKLGYDTADGLILQKTT